MQRQQYRYQRQQKEQDNNNNNNIYSTGSVWLTGPKRRPTVQLPSGLTKKFMMDQPCRVAFFDMNNDDGILIRFLHINRPPDS